MPATSQPVLAAFQAARPLPLAAGRVVERLDTLVAQAGLVLSATCGRPVATPRAGVTRRPAGSLPADVAWYPLDCGLDGPGALLVPDLVGTALADALLGGPGYAEARPLSDLELKVLRRQAAAAVAALAEAFEPLGVTRLALGAPGDGAVAVALAGRDLVCADVEVTVGTTTGALTFAIPVGTITEPAPAPRGATDVAAFAHVPFDLRVTLPPTTLPAADVEQLAPGDVIRLDAAGEVPLLALLADRVVLSGVLGTHGRHRAFTVAHSPWSAR